ncbi:MAG: long-chain fatty acid--CoA ligase [Nitriliruptor sp.]|nr:MAG: long-chain fatty acid--CoA ligase [Nitriliruptor sp.]
MGRSSSCGSTPVGSTVMTTADQDTIMREATGRGQVDLGDERTLLAALRELAAEDPDRPAVAYRDGDHFSSWSLGHFLDEVDEVARGLIGIGIEPGQPVCIFSATRLEWAVLDYAVWAAGAISVPIYETSSAEQVEWIVSNSGAVALVAETRELLAEYEKVAEKLPTCEHTEVIENGGLQRIKDAGSDVSPEAVREREDALRPEQLATIVYTSGTTGRPKGCRITHRNLVFNVAAARVALDQLIRPGRSTLLFLPLAHIFSRLIQATALRSRVLLGFASGPDRVQEELPMFRPTFLLGVPRVFEKVINGARRTAQEQGKGWLFDRAIDVAERHSRQPRPGLWTSLQHQVFDRLVYTKLRAGVGGEVEYAISGGTALGERTGHRFRGIGITILEGYGLTETTAPIAVSRPDALRIGLVGEPLPEVSIRIADDGEIEVRGDNVFAGYHENPEATEEVLDDDGWFSTGDLGELDEDGFLGIVGRKKDMVITAGGINVTPDVLEDRLTSHPLVSEAIILGDNQPFVGALIALDPEEAEAWADQQDRSGEMSELAEDEQLRSEIQSAVDDANDAVSRAESIREFRIIPGELSTEDGELTPTQKAKREVVEERFSHLIDDIYADVER